MKATRYNSLLPLAATSVLAVSGCGTIQENNQILNCQGTEGARVEATTNPSANNYDQATDPAYISAKTLEEAREELDKQDNDTWKNLVVGVGQVACTGKNGKLYLTDEGVLAGMRLSK